MASEAELWERVQTVEFGKALPIKDARTILRRCDSFTRLRRLVAMSSFLEVERDDWLRLLGEVWSSCDNVAEMAEGTDLWETPFGDLIYTGAGRDLVMDEAERAVFDAMPETVTLYRGCYALNKWGLSWSLDRETAARFPTINRYRQAGQPLLVTATAPRNNIAFVKLDRDEQEVVCLRPKHVSTRHIRQ